MVARTLFSTSLSRTARRWSQFAIAAAFGWLGAASPISAHAAETNPATAAATASAAVSAGSLVAGPIMGPVTVEKAPATLQLEPGLVADLVAAEPLVASPVATAFDEQGRMFVAENRGYPTGPAEGQPAQGRIAQLIDVDGDGRCDKRVEFATELSFPNGLLPWRGGLIVTCSPEILWLADTDGDGRADRREVLLTGFSTTGSTQLRVSHPTLGSDGWVYVTSGLTGGKVIAPGFPDRPPVEIKRTDLRFRPGTGQFEAADGGAQFGLSFDDFGRRFICYNRVQVQHVVTSSRYWQRNPRLPFADTVQNCPAELAPEPLRGHGQAARLFPASNNVTTADSHAGTFTAACGVTVWRGDALPAVYDGGVFACDPTGNLVHFDRLEPAGATFAARRARDGSEFLASRDNWCRPVHLGHAPDGALYVCDMYRKTIEHPDYLPVEIRKRTDFTSGKDLGRIWRIRREDLSPAELARRASARVHPQSPSSERLATALADPNGWSRDTATRLLWERLQAGDKSRTEALAALHRLLSDHHQPIASSPPPSPRPAPSTTAASAVTTAPAAATATAPANATAPMVAAVAAALRLLDAAGELTDDELATALQSDSPGVRELAVVAAEPRLVADPKWLDRLIPLAGDASARVRFQVALTLGSSDSPRTLAALASIALRDGADRWARAAVFSAVAGREPPLFAALMAQSAASKEAPSADAYSTVELWTEMGRMLGAATASSATPSPLSVRLGEILNAASTTAVNGSAEVDFVRSAALLSGFGEALRGRGVPSSDTVGVLRAVLAQASLASGEDQEKAASGPSPAAGAATASTNASTNASTKATAERLNSLFNRALSVAVDRTAAEPARRLALSLLAHADFATAGERLLELVDPSEPMTVQSGAARALGLMRSPRIATTLLDPERFRGYTPRLREEVIGAVLANSQHLPGLIEALEAGAVPPNAIDSLRRRQLTDHRDPALRARAQKVYANATPGNRAAVYDDLKAVVSLDANPTQGKQVFKRVCASCHRLDQDGSPVGPDLFGIRNQPKEAILLHIVIPEQEITQGFAAYVVATHDGRVLTGLLAAETPTSVTLRQALGKEETILRSDIERIAASQLSLMPQELEKQLSRQDFADLLAYLKGQ